MKALTRGRGVTIKARNLGIQILKNLKRTTPRKKVGLIVKGAPTRRKGLLNLKKILTRILGKILDSMIKIISSQAEIGQIETAIKEAL